MVEFIIEFLIKSSVVLSLVTALTYCRHISAAERHTLAFAGILSLLIIVSADGVFEWRIAMPTPNAAATTAIQPGSKVLNEFPVTTNHSVGPSVEDGLSWLVVVYLGMVTLLVVHAFAGWLGFRHKMRRLTEPDSSVSGMQLPRHVHIRTDNCSSPWTWGIRRVFIILPEEFFNWPVQRQREAFHHELAHVNRRDSLVRSVCHCLAIVFWFQPLIWLVRSRLHRLAELASDDCVIEQGAPAIDYAQSLLNIAKQNNRSEAAGVSMSSHPLTSRIESILNSTIRRTPMKLPRFAILTAFVFTMALPVAALKAESNVPYTRKYFPILKTQPVYPPEALAQGIEGYVIVRFDVTERGFTGNVTVYEESPEGVFGEAAVQAAQNYRYLPGRKDGENVAVSGVRSRVLFTLPNSADREGSEYGLVTQDELEVALSDDNMLDWHLVTQAIYDAKGERTRRQSILTGIMLEAEALAERTGNGDGLISAAALATAWRDVGWATYCLMRATEYRLSKPELLRYQLAPLYWQIGRFDDAKVLFIEDADSNEYDKQWLKHLDGEKRRRSVVYDALVSTLSAVVQN